MSEDELPRETVMAVLRAAGVSVADVQGPKGVQTVLVKDFAKGQQVEVQFFPELVPRRVIIGLGIKFEIPRHYFWHPEMMPNDGGKAALPS